MSFNQRNLNTNIWEPPRHNNPQSFINNQQNFYGNNNSNLPQNFPPRPNFHPQQNQLRPLLNLPQIPGQHDHHQNFRNFNNNNQDFVRNNNNRGRQNFHNHNQQKWQNRGNDNKDTRFSDSTKDNSNNGERFSREPSAENSQNSQQNDDSRPKSLVEHLKSTMKKNPRSKSQENPANESIDACAKNASKKLLSQLKTMDKDNVKELINNPKQPHRKAVLNIQAREKLREGMRKQLKTLGAEDDQEVSFDAVESVNYENIPETLIAQIGRTVDMDLNVEDMDLQPDMDDDIVEDKDIEVVTKNLGNDFLYGSEMLLMNGFNLLGESENEADLKIPEERFFPPPLPTEPIPRPPEPVPPPEKPPSQRLDDWEIDTARNPDPPNFSSKINENIQTIPVIVSHPPPPIQTLPPLPTTNINTSVNNVSKKHDNPLLVVLNEAKEQIPLTTNNSTNNVKNSTNNIGSSSLAENKLVKIHSSSSQDSFKTPSIPDPITSTPFSNDGNKTPFGDISKMPFNDGGKTPFDDGGKTPFIGSETPFIGSETPFIGSETPFVGSETPFIGSGDDKNPFETPKRQKMSGEDKKPVIEGTPGSDQPKADENNDTKQRANETYGEYRRRLANLGEEESSTPKDDFSKPTKRPPPAPKRNQQNKEWDEDIRSPANSDKGSWISNNRNNNENNNNNNRKSRFEMNRSRDKNNRNNDRNNFNNKNNRNNSPRTPVSPWDTSRDKDRDRDREDMRDAFNYRFDNNNSSNNTEGGEVDRLSNLLNPKPVQFKGSFNKRSGFSNHNKNSRDFGDERSRDFLPERSRERTPVNNSVERELFDISSPNDARPCYHTLKKIIEIETEINRIHDKIHGIDKVISNLQTERIGYQKSFTRLQHDKKILLDNLAKRAMANDKDKDKDSNERTTSREREKDKEKDTSFEIRPHKENKKEKDTSTKNKTIEVVVEQKKRKIDDTPQILAQDDENKKKKKYTLEEEPKSAAQKAREKEEEERRKRIEEIRRQKQLRREKEEAERRKLEEEAKKESNDKILVINREKVHAKLKEREKEKKKEQNIQSPSPPKPSPKKSMTHLFSSGEVIDPTDVKMKKFKIQFEKLSLKQNILDQFQAGKCPEIDINELPRTSSSNVSVESDKSVDDLIKIIKSEAEQSSNKQSKSEQPSFPSKTSEVSVTSIEKDPLAIDDIEEIVNPPTPGSNLTLNEDNDTNASDQVNNDQDYSEWTGNFESHNQPIVHIQNIDGKHMVCAAEDGKLYKYRLSNGKCDAIFSKHTEICNSFLYEDTDKTIYTASSDGFVYRIKLKIFDSIASKHFNEPLQVIEKSKYALYVGAKSGNIYKLKLDLSDEKIEPLCCVDALILCMRSAKEGSRHILLISSRMNAIQVRDASEGLLLRTLSNDLTGVSIYDMLLEGSTIYCGSNLHEIFAIDFTTGALKKKRSMSGAGAICVRIYKENLIVACYDGNIYIFDLNADDDACNITGPSNMLLAMDLWDDKIIASTKDKTLKIMNIPT